MTIKQALYADFDYSSAVMMDWCHGALNLPMHTWNCGNVVSPDGDWPKRSLPQIMADLNIQPAETLLIVGGSTKNWSPEVVEIRESLGEYPEPFFSITQTKESLSFVHDAKLLQMAILGICGGHQLLCSYLGYTLERLLGDGWYGELNAIPTRIGIPEIKVSCANQVAAIVDDDVDAAVLHQKHASIMTMVSLPTKMIGVQWHPEYGSHSPTHSNNSFLRKLVNLIAKEEFSYV